MTFVPVIVDRLVSLLPTTTNRPIEYVLNDESVQQLSSILVDLAQTADGRRTVLQVLLLSLHLLLRDGNRDTPSENQLASQLYIFDLIATCTQEPSKSPNSDLTWKPAVPFSNDTISADVVETAFDCAVLVLQGSTSTVSVSEPATSFYEAVSRPISFTSSSITSRKTHGQHRRRQSSSNSLRPVQELRLLPQVREMLKRKDAHAEKLIAYISAANWSATSARIALLLRDPYREAYEDSFNQKIRLMAYLSLDLAALDALVILVESSSSVLRKSSQVIVLESLLSCFSTWSREHPEQFSDVHVESRLQSSVIRHASKLYDLVQNNQDLARKKHILWPLMVYLIMLYPKKLESTEARLAKAPFCQERILDYKNASHVLTTFAHVLHAVSYLPRQRRTGFDPIVNNILTTLTLNLSLWKDCVDQRLFTESSSLFQSSFRLGISEFHSMAMSSLNLWLNQDAAMHSRVVAIQSIQAILSDPAHIRPYKEPSIMSLIEATTNRLSTLFMSDFTESDGSSIKSQEPSAHSLALSNSILELFSTAPEIIIGRNGSPPSLKMDQALIGHFYRETPLKASPAARLILEILHPSCVRGSLFGNQFHKNKEKFWRECWIRFSALALRKIAERISIEWNILHDNSFLIDLLLACMSARLDTLREFSAWLGVEDDVEEHMITRLKLESVLLSLTCHMEYKVASKAAKACALLVQEATIYAPFLSSMAAAEDNTALFNALAGETFLTSGRNAMQRKIRGHLRCALSSSSLRNAWLDIFGRWSIVSDQIASHEEMSSQDDSVARAMWQNYTGFLAAAARIEDCNANDPVFRFIARFRLIVSDYESKESMSEVGAEIIGGELHISVFNPMLREIQGLLGTMSDKKGVLIVRNRNTLLMEHLILICRGLFERLENYPGAREDLNVGKVLMDMGSYLELCGDSQLRSRLRFCQLCVIVATKIHFVCMPEEDRILRQLCNRLAAWISPRADISHGYTKIWKDLNLVCLKALVRLTKDMCFAYEPLSGERQCMGSLDRLLDFVLPLLAVTKDEGLVLGIDSALVCDLLYNILDLNQGVVLSSFVSLCYSPDNGVREAFSSVIARKMESGVNTMIGLSNIEIQKMIWASLSTDGNRLTAFIDGCYATKPMCEQLIRIFDTQGLAEQVFSLVLSTEVATCGQESELFRRNSTPTRYFAAYAKLFFSDYVAETIREPFARLQEHDDEYDMELDVTRLDLKDGDDAVAVLDRNRRRMESACQCFIDAICTSGPRMPAKLLHILQLVAARTAERYPLAVQNSVGSFLILRLIGPAILKAGASGTTVRIRRQVVVVVKLLTNLANNTFFKEHHMAPVNEFLRSNIFKLSMLIRDVSSARDRALLDAPLRPLIYIPPSEDMEEAWLIGYKCADQIKLRTIEINLQLGTSVDELTAMLGAFYRLIRQLSIGVEPGSPRDRSDSSATQSTAVSSVESGPESRTPKSASLETPSRQIECASSLALTSTTDHAQASFVSRYGLNFSGGVVYCLDLGQLQQTDRPVGETVASINAIVEQHDAHDLDILIDVTTHISSRRFGNWQEKYDALFATKLVQQCSALYFYNVNTSFLRYLERWQNENAFANTLRIRFIDIGDSLERYFHPATCRRIKSKHGDPLKTYSQALQLCSMPDQEDIPVRLGFFTGNKAFLSSVGKRDVALSFKIRVVECFDLLEVKDIRVSQNTVELSLAYQPVVKLKTAEPQALVQEIRRVLVHIRGDEHLRKLVLSSEDVVYAKLLTLGLTKVACLTKEARHSGILILNEILEHDRLREHCILPRSSLTTTALQSTEIRVLHEIACRGAGPGVRKAVLRELLFRVPQMTFEQSLATLACLDIWLGCLQDHQPHEIEDLKDVLTSLISIQYPWEDTRWPAKLWCSLGEMKNMQGPLLDSLCEHATLFHHSASQVADVSQILRTMDISIFIGPVADKLMTLINAGDCTLLRLNLSRHWPEIEVMLRLLVDLTSRTAQHVSCLPEIVYIALSLLKEGDYEIRKLTWQLVAQAISCTMYDEDPSDPRYEKLLFLLQDRSESGLQCNFLLESQEKQRQLLLQHWTALEQVREIRAADMLQHVIVGLIDVLKYSATDLEQESVFLGRLSRLVTDATFAGAPMRRRYFLAIGLLSAELKVGTVRPLLSPLALGIKVACEMNSLGAVAVTLCLSFMDLQEPAVLLKVALAICMMPISSLASAGLRLLMKCLQSFERGRLDVQECFSAPSPAWMHLETTTGISITQHNTMGFCCVLVNALQVSGSTDMVKRVALFLLKMYTTDDQAAIETSTTDVIPILVVLAMLANNQLELNSFLAIGRMPLQGSTEKHPLRSILVKEYIKDDSVALLVASMLALMCITTESMPLRISLLNSVSDMAKECPIAFAAIFEHLRPYIVDIVASSKDEGLLGAAHLNIISFSDIVNRADRHNKPAFGRPLASQLSELGFTYLARDAVNSDKTWDGDAAQTLETYKDLARALLDEVE